MIKQLIKFAFSYTAIEGSQRGVLFLLLPLFTSYMTPDEFGIVSTSLIIISFLSVLFSLAIHSAIARYYFKYEKDPEELKEFLGTNFIFLTAFSFSIGILLVLLGEPISHLLFEEIAFDPYIIYTLSIVASQVVILAYFSLLKAMQRLRLYAVVFNTYFLVQITLMAVLITQYELKQDGYLLGILITNIAFIPIVFFLLREHIVFTLKIKYIKESLDYSLPIIPVDLIGNVNRLIDRYYILLFIGLGGVGVYYIGVQIASLIHLVALAINSAYTPMFFKKYENSINEDYQDIYRLADLIVFVMGAVAAIFIIIAPLLLTLFDKAYQEALTVILYLGFSGALTSVYFLNTNVLSLEPRLVKLKTIGIIFGAVINVILGYILTKYHGIEGAAISTLIGFFMTTLILVFIVKKKTAFTFDNSKYLLYLGFLFLLLVIIEDMQMLYQLLSVISVLIILFLIKFNPMSGGFYDNLKSRV